MNAWAVAHRGDPRGAVENTLEALSLAQAAGVDAIEVDLQVTRDGVVVLQHDADLSRLWAQADRIAELTLDQLRVRAPRIPTLAEALAVTTTPLLLDTGDPEVAVAAHAELTRLGATAMFCGAAEAMAAVRSRDDGITLFMSWYSAQSPSSDVLAAVRPQYFNPEHVYLTESEVASWHERGLRVSCWTVDDAARRAELLAWGVDGIISNDVEGLVKSCAGA